MSTKQQSLFDLKNIPKPEPFLNADVTANKHGGNEQSAQAHERVKPTKLTTWDKIYNWALEQGDIGITADEAAAHFGCSHNHVAPRITELRNMNLLVPNNKKRNTRSNSPAAVYVAVPKNP